MIASLPMYDWPEIRVYTDLFWSNMSRLLRVNHAGTPEKLDRSDCHSQWQRTDLFLSQTCIFPLATKLPETIVVLGTPLYNAPNCKHGHYASVVLIREDDKRQDLASFRNSTLAFNSTDSQSGFNSLRNLLIQQGLLGDAGLASKADLMQEAGLMNDAGSGFFSDAICTGSHRISVNAVVAGNADLCAIDPVGWALAQEYEPNDAQALRVLTTTGSSPALPLVCNASTLPGDCTEQQWRETIMSAFNQAIQQTAAPQLLLDGITHIPKSEYLQLQISNLDMFTNPGHN